MWMVVRTTRGAAVATVDAVAVVVVADDDA